MDNLRRKVIPPFPINDLPPPLLAEVFSHAVREDGVDSLFALMRTCRAWEEIAYSPPVLKWVRLLNAPWVALPTNSQYTSTTQFMEDLIASAMLRVAEKIRMNEVPGALEAFRNRLGPATAQFVRRKVLSDLCWHGGMRKVKEFEHYLSGLPGCSGHCEGLLVRPGLGAHPYNWAWRDFPDF
ncbi:hypothetical protein CJ030_MR1G014926 [Morella rubra]|uniref:F-box domain-containing protein n=1 Tax=Morella rubra TaxID=262757 RepID=A0A6A1WP47_9ROSI|nr:hypothetical protein CJ030_MR1G014929 [Morella rubra]KAB1227052.1 hypothetical protein CJ030_MR1G014926 [Morella rubra]